MLATVFFTKMFLTCITVEEKTAEECLAELTIQMTRTLNWRPTLTFRPADGMIFCSQLSSIAPIGVLYRQGY